MRELAGTLRELAGYLRSLLTALLELFGLGKLSGTLRELAGSLLHLLGSLKELSWALIYLVRNLVCLYPFICYIDIPIVITLFILVYP